MQFSKDYQNSTSPKDECYLRSLKNSQVLTVNWLICWFGKTNSSILHLKMTTCIQKVAQSLARSSLLVTSVVVLLYSGRDVTSQNQCVCGVCGGRGGGGGGVGGEDKTIRPGARGWFLSGHLNNISVVYSWSSIARRILFIRYFEWGK